MAALAALMLQRGFGAFQIRGASMHRNTEEKS